MGGEELRGVVLGVLGKVFVLILIFFNFDLCLKLFICKYFFLVKVSFLFKCMYLENKYIKLLFFIDIGAETKLFEFF